MQRIRIIIAATAACLLVLVGTSPAGWATLPPDDGLLAPEPPTVTAKSWLLYDDTFGKVLAAQEADTQASVASTTKIMTALVVIERTTPDDPVGVTEASALVGESQIGLVAGEAPWSVEEMLAALLLHSANDAAVALAQHVGGSVQGFAELMNLEAAQLGLRNSHFVNPHGLDHPDHYSSARDLLTISLAAIELPRFARLARALSVNLPPTPEGEPRVALNRNELIAEYPGALGIKTGYTDDALLTLVAAAEREGRRLYAVVLGSTDHFSDATALLEYGFAEFGPLTLVPVTSAIQRPLSGGLEVEPAEDFELFEQQEPVEVTPQEQSGTGTDAPDPTSEPSPADTGNGQGGASTLKPDDPAETIGEPVLTRTDLPGLREALVWFERYWQWIRERR